MVIKEKDFLLLPGLLALLVTAPTASAEATAPRVSSPRPLDDQEQERFSSLDAEFQVEKNTTHSPELSHLSSQISIPENSSYNFQKLPTPEFSLLSSERLPGIGSVNVLNNRPTLTELTLSNPLPSVNTQTTLAKSVKLEIDTDTELISQTPAASAQMTELPSVTEQSSPDFNNSINTEISEERSTDDSLDQVNSVTQLSDVQPTDWAFSALQNLVERYGCIAGYPDSTFRGNRSMSRYEFAAGLNACLTQIEKLVAEKTAAFVRKDDLDTLQRLTDEFRTELTNIGSRVNSLEARTTQLENHQFSTTAKLGGEAIFGLATAGGGNPPGTGKANTVFNHLTRLQIATSFTGLDRLRLELSAANFSGFGFADPNVLNTFTSLLSYQADTNNQIQLSMLEYRFPAFNNRVVFTVRPVGFSLSNVLSANSPYFDTGRGSISRFGEANPIFKIGALDAGVGFDWLLTKRTRLQFAYGARNGNDTKEGFLFSGNSNVMGAQLLTLLGNDALTGITLVYGYSSNGRLNTFTGSAIADASGFINLPSNIYAVGGTLQWRITPTLTFSTWGGLTATYAASTNAFATTSNFMFGLGFSDPFGRRGDLFAVMVGQPPRLIQAGGYVVANGGLLEKDRSLHLEAFYRFTVTDRISITPGFFVVTNPGNIGDNNAIYVGAIRSTFRF